MASVVTVTGPADAAVNQAGTYYPLSNARLLDTRLTTAKPTLGPGETLTLQVSGKAGIPALGVSAAVVNLTVAGATAGSYLTVYPTGQARPTVSSINFPAGLTVANISTVKLGTGGKVSIFNHLGSTAVIVDVVGFYALNDTPSQTLGKGNEYTTVDPHRLFDTRTDTEGPVAGDSFLTASLDFGDNGSLNSSVRAVAINVTAVRAKGSGHLSVVSGDDLSTPKTSTLTFTSTAPIPNMAVVKTTLCGDCGSPASVQFAIYNSSKDTVDVFADIVGVYYQDTTPGLRFNPINPLRITDTRIGQNATTLTAQQTKVLTSGAAAVAATYALVTNTTLVAPTANTYLSLWMSGARPNVSNLNATAGRTVANGAVVEITGDHKFSLYNSAGSSNVLMDVTGRFDDPSATATQAAVRSEKFAPSTAARQTR
jgi:hypothetical protein